MCSWIESEVAARCTTGVGEAVKGAVANVVIPLPVVKWVMRAVV